MQLPLPVIFTAKKPANNFDVICCSSMKWWNGRRTVCGIKVLKVPVISPRPFLAPFHFLLQLPSIYLIKL